MDKRQMTLEFRTAIRLFLATLDVDNDLEAILEVPSAFPPFKVGKHYKVKEVFRYGENAVGDAQLYQVLQDHISAEEWVPGTVSALYKAVGVTEDGTPEWVQPLGASDAYNTGDIVMHKGAKYRSTVDANVWEPGVYGWEQF